MSAKASEFDNVLEKLEKALLKVQASQEKPLMLPGKELDLLSHCEKARDFMHNMLQSDDRDRVQLIEVFGGDCVRVARLRGVLEAIKLSERNANDQRLPTCIASMEIVENVLIEKGLNSRLKEAQSDNVPWKPAGSKAEQIAEPAPAADPAPAPAPISPAPTLAAPKATTIVTSGGSAFPQQDDVKRQINVSLSCEVSPEIDFGPNETIVLQLDEIKAKVETTVTPELSDVSGLKEFARVQEPILKFPDASKVVFDPAKKEPAGGRWECQSTMKVQLLQYPSWMDAAVGSQSMSPWGSTKLKDGKGESEMHYEVALHGQFQVEQENDKSLLSIDLTLHFLCMLSGAHSASYTPDGSILGPPERD